MGNRVTIGGDRLGSGKKMKASLSSYRRSTFNLGRQVRATMAPGILYPIVVEPMLTKDTFDVDLKTLIKTIPAIKPLFGSYKLQADVFTVPMRLYNKQMHNNPVGLGMHVDKVIFPKIKVSGNDIFRGESNANEAQVNQSSLMAYTGVRGLGRGATAGQPVVREFNMMPILGYYDIFKNYYANKQEDDAYVITANVQGDAPIALNSVAYNGAPFIGPIVQEGSTYIQYGAFGTTVPTGTDIIFSGEGLMQVSLGNVGLYENTASPIDPVTLRWRFSASVDVLAHTETQIHVRTKTPMQVVGPWGFAINGTTAGTAVVVKTPVLQSFPLTNIDEMRETLLSAPKEVPFIFDQSDIETGLLPYAANNNPLVAVGGTSASGCLGNMAGLVVKTYQSDRFNNWVNTEWIDGEGGISELTAVDTTEGSFTMDDLNLRQKIYNMLNNIGMAGGTLRNWREAVYGVSLPSDHESPEYHGGMSSEIYFDDVVSHTDGGEESPLGSLAGRGVLADKGKGSVRVSVSEESYLYVIVSITPRVDYSQGNKWFTEIETLDDLHKPELDQIGFQSTPTWQAAAFDRIVNPDGTLGTENSFGKQPAWTEYMTAVNEVFGDFAEEGSQMSMVLNRRYEADSNGALADATTYIDPTKFNYVFAGTDLSYENFWVQMNVDIKARRIMSGAIMPRM